MQIAKAAVAVFDLDGTLLDGDSTALWMRGVVLKSPLRSLAFLLLAPALYPFVLWPRTRRSAASALLYVATFGMDFEALEASVQAFAEDVNSGRSALSWRANALIAVREHAAEGHVVAVATAAPELLAKALCTKFGAEIFVFGSSLKHASNGWIADRHCRHEEKCKILAEAGFGSTWSYVYSDSADDLPMLVRADIARLVNPSAKTIRRVSAERIKVEPLFWS